MCEGRMLICCGVNSVSGRRACTPAVVECFVSAVERCESVEKGGGMEGGYRKLWACVSLCVCDVRACVSICVCVFVQVCARMCVCVQSSDCLCRTTVQVKQCRMMRDTEGQEEEKEGGRE